MKSPRLSDLSVIPMTLKEAQVFVAQHHRHHKPPVSHKFSVGVAYEGRVVGVAMVGRPVARHLDDGWTLEINRLTTDGTRNACSVLLGAVRRATFALGYRKLVTYTLPSEGGASLKASGYRCVGEAGGGSWHCVARPRVDTHPTQVKLKWEVTAHD